MIIIKNKKNFKNLFILLGIINLANLLFIAFFSVHSYALTNIVNLKLPVVNTISISLLGAVTQFSILVIYIFFNRFATRIIILAGLFISTGFVSYLLGIQLLSEYEPCGNCILSSILFILLFFIFLAQLFKQYIIHERSLQNKNETTPP